MSNITETKLGRVQPRFRGEYSALQSYDKLDWVTRSGSTYVCKTRGALTPPEISADWQLIASKGATGSQGPSGGFGVVVATATSLGVGDVPTASVEITGGTPYAKNFKFSFGIPAGPLGFTAVNASAHSIAAGTTATVSAALSTVGDVTTLEFEFGIPAASGEGIKTIDTSYGPDTSGNVALAAVRYVPQILTEDQQQQVCTNINAIPQPNNKIYGQFLQFGGNVSDPAWIAQTINEVPIGGISGYVLRKQVGTYGWTPSYEIPTGGLTGAALVKASDVNYDVTWTGVITTNDIDQIIEA